MDQIPAERGERDLRGLLFSIAYEMLGAVGDAEDIVQEAFLRLHRIERDGGVIESRRAFLTTVTARLAIDELRSARVRRERYFGPWLPEPLLTGTEPDPAELAQTADALSLSFLVLLERLSPVERAVFLLREVFDYGYAEIAEIVARTEVNCRQICARARKRIESGKRRFSADKEQQKEIAARFVAAFEDGEVEHLIELLSPDVVFTGDGGGKGAGLPRPVFGRAGVGRLLGAVVREGRAANASIQQVEINGQSGTLNFDADGSLINVFVFEVADGSIQAIRSIINPDKLDHLGYPLSELGRRRSSSH
jgi:RNA polymerase sigma-70 factor (ECF subfamily)